MNINPLEAVRSAAKEKSDAGTVSPYIDPLDEIFRHEHLKNRISADKASLEEIDKYFKEIGKPLDSLIPETSMMVQKFFNSEILDLGERKIPHPYLRREGRYFKKVKKTQAGTDHQWYEMEFRSHEAAIAYWDKLRKGSSSTAKLSFHPQQGESVNLHETNWEQGKTGLFFWCFTPPGDTSSYQNLFFSVEATARQYAKNKDLRIISESGSFIADETTVESNSERSAKNSGIVFSLPRMCPDELKKKLWNNENQNEDDLQF